MSATTAKTDAPRLRLAMLIGSMQEGGTEGQLLELMRGLRSRGHDARLLLIHPKGPLLPLVEAADIPTHLINLPKLRPLWHPANKAQAWKRLNAAVAYLREFNPDVLHCWLFEAEALGWILKKRGAPGAFVTSRRSMGDYKNAAPWKQRVQNLYNRDSIAIVANSHAVAKDSLSREKNLPREKLHVIYNAVDATRFQNAPKLDRETAAPLLANATHLVLTVGNLFEYKGYYDLVEAWRIVGREFPNAHLLFAGRDAGIGGELRGRIHGTGFNHRIHLLGPRQDVPQLMKTCDLFVLASHEEGMPNVVIEAQAAGLPVIATRVGGTPEAMADNKTGILVPPRDVEKLASALCALLGDAERRRAYGQAGPQFVGENFSVDRMVGEYESLYLKLIHRA